MKTKAPRETRRWQLSDDGEKAPMDEAGFRIPLASGCWLSVNLCGAWHRGFAVIVSLTADEAQCDRIPQLAVLPHSCHSASVEVRSSKPDDDRPPTVVAADSTELHGAPAGARALTLSHLDAMQGRKFIVEYGQIACVDVDVISSGTALPHLRIQARGQQMAEDGKSHPGLYMTLDIAASNLLRFWFSEVEFTSAE